jgi:hypothetical protein
LSYASIMGVNKYAQGERYAVAAARRNWTVQ